jgi:ATP-dependent helicase HrpB
VLLTERGLGGNDADLEGRLRRWRGERGKRAEAARGLAKRWAALVGGLHPNAVPQTGEGVLGACIALAFPDRVAKRRGGDGADWISAGGRGFKLDPLSPLAREPWLAVAETQGMAAGARILSAAPISEAEVEALFGDRIQTLTNVRFDAGAVAATRERRLGAIVLTRGPADRITPHEIETALIEGIRTSGVDLLPWGEAASALRLRAAFAGVADLSDTRLLADLDLWLPPLLAGKRRLSDIDPGALHGALEALIGWEGKSAIDRLAPAMLETPAGSSHTIDYGAEGGPAVEVRVQALFGMTRHPMLGDGTPITLRLTSPAGRPIQTTKDLPGFWAGSWAAVAKEMRGRYPRHPWPDDPAAASATLRTKKADARRG